MRRGAVALETAFVLPVAFLCLFGVMDWSWYMFQRVTVTTAAQRGARMAAGVPSTGDITGTARTAATEWLLDHGIDGTAEVTTSRSTKSYGLVVTVDVELTFVPLTGLVPTPSQLHGRATASWFGDFGS